MTRRRRLVEAPPEPLTYAAACQQAMLDAVGERSRAFLAAAEAGHSMAAIASAVAMSPAGVHKIVVAAERREAGR